MKFSDFNKDFATTYWELINSKADREKTESLIIKLRTMGAINDKYNKRVEYGFSLGQRMAFIQTFKEERSRKNGDRFKVTTGYKVAEIEIVKAVPDSDFVTVKFENGQAFEYRKTTLLHIGCWRCISVDI